MTRLFLLFLLISNYSFSQEERRVAILNMSSILEETNDSRLYAATHLMDLVGIPYDVLDSLDNAFNYPVIITATSIRENAFTTPQINLISEWVNNGGVLITSGLRDQRFNDICGINDITSTNLSHQITWDTVNYPMYFDQIDDELEVTISLGREPSPIFVTRYYTVASGVVLGKYEDNTCALVYNEYGLGHVYTFGPDLRDVIIRPQINKDYGAQRTYSNGFEPSLDVFAFIARNIIRNHIPFTIYKYPAVQNSSATLLITHDVDSKTAVDSLFYFSDYETSKDFICSYNITTKYFSNQLSGAFYNQEAITTINNLLINRHDIASHSVGHFPDFSNQNAFPFGQLGNTMNNYSPIHSTGTTIGGSVLGELEVSKNILTTDFDIEINSWRSGHLSFPDSLIRGLELLGYSYNSSYSANDVLTAFPYYAFSEQRFSSNESIVIEIPIVISDVFNASNGPINKNNHLEKADVWLEITKKYTKNNACINLLIHPNRGYKLESLSYLIDHMSPSVKVISFEAFGKFWRDRNNLDYNSSLSNDTLYVNFLNSLSPKQSFVIDNADASTVIFTNYLGEKVHFFQEYFNGNQNLYYQSAITKPTNNSILNPNCYLYPNPSNENLTVNFGKELDAVTLTIYSITGKKLIVKRFVKTNQIELSNNDINLESGVYILSIQSKELTTALKFIRE